MHCGVKCYILTSLVREVEYIDCFFLGSFVNIYGALLFGLNWVQLGMTKDVFLMEMEIEEGANWLMGGPVPLAV